MTMPLGRFLLKQEELLTHHILQAVVASCDDALSELAGFQCERPTYLKVRVIAQASSDSDHHHHVETGCQFTRH